MKVTEVVFILEDSTPQDDLDTWLKEVGATSFTMATIALVSIVNSGLHPYETSTTISMTNKNFGRMFYFLMAKFFVPGAAVGVIKLVDLNTPEKRALVLANAEARILAYEKAMNLQEPRTYDNFFFADMPFTQAIPAAVQAPEADDGDVFDEN